MDLFPYIAVFLSIVITTFNYGYFSFQGLSVLICLYILLLLLFFKKKPNKLGKTLNVETIQYLFIITYTLFLFFSGGIYQINTLPSYLLAFLPLLSFPIVVTYTISPKGISKRAKVYRYVFLVGVAFFLRLFIIQASPRPVIDVFTMLKEAPYNVLQGINPYRATFTQVYEGVKLDYYTYWPASFLVQIPFLLIFKDPRVLLFLADIASAMLIFLIGKKTRIAEIFSLIYLFRPNSNFIIEQSWLAPLELFLILFLIYLLCPKKNPKVFRRDFLAGAILAIVVGVRQQYLVLAPFFLFVNIKIKYFLAGLLIFLSLILLPFLIWNFKAFYLDTIYYFLRPSDKSLIAPIHKSLTLNTLVYNITGWDIPLIMSVAIISLAAFLLLSRYRTQASFLSDFVLVIVLFLLTSYLVFGHIFINYYYVLSGLIITWIVMLESENRKY